MAKVVVVGQVIQNTMALYLRGVGQQLDKNQRLFQQER